MKERCISIPTPSGAMETFTTHPDRGGPFPAVIVYMDIWGVREELFDIARRVATVSPPAPPDQKMLFRAFQFNGQ